jgi:hypothetical protein
MPIAIPVKTMPPTEERPDITQTLYQLSEPLRWRTAIHVPGVGRDVEYIICSRANVPYSGWETYAFWANEEGEIVSWQEMPGSMRGEDVTDADVLGHMGYTIVHVFHKNQKEPLRLEYKEA